MGPETAFGVYEPFYFVAAVKNQLRLMSGHPAI
jgi:hypothetical protein